VRNHGRAIVAWDFFQSATLDFKVLYVLIAMENERHLRGIVQEFVTHYNRGRPHSALGPRIPEPLQATTPAGPHSEPLNEVDRME
jgi:transposase InsO family protein